MNLSNEDTTTLVPGMEGVTLKLQFRMLELELRKEYARAKV